MRARWLIGLVGALALTSCDDPKPETPPGQDKVAVDTAAPAPAPEASRAAEAGAAGLSKPVEPKPPVVPPQAQQEAPKPVEAPKAVPTPAPAPKPAPKPVSKTVRLALQSSIYDEELQRSAATWLPGVPWQLLKAQMWQESRFDTNAKSPVGAAGVAQFMPATWAHVAAQLGYQGVSPHVAEPAIMAAGYYMMTLRKFWKHMPDWAQHNHAMASYNAGPGNIQKAWTRCNKQPDWSQTVICLESVTGHHHKETTQYVERIWYWYGMLQ